MQQQSCRGLSAPATQLQGMVDVQPSQGKLSALREKLQNDQRTLGDFTGAEIQSPSQVCSFLATLVVL